MRPLFLFLAVSALLGLASCIRISDEVFDEPRQVTESVELGDVEMVNARIRMPAGNLRVTGGAAGLMDGEFTFRSPKLEPVISYDSSSFRGRLQVEGQRGKLASRIGPSDRWLIKLNNDVPLDLDVEIGAGESNLDLSGMSLRSLKVRMGAGECNIDLVGEWGRNFRVDVKGGVGELTVRVPNNVGIVAEAKGGLGEVNARGLRRRNGKYVNDAYGESPVTISLDLKGGIGEINIIAVN